MPIFTPNYGLACFLDGDIYAAAEDLRRFTIIDNQIAAASRFIGDGIISGWELAPGIFPAITITKGSGIIGGFYTSTDSDYIVDTGIIPDSKYYFFAKKSLNIISGYGKPSSLLSISITDNSAPVAPANFTVVSPFSNEDAAPNDMVIYLNWDQNTEIDFSHYLLSRSTNNVDYSLLGSITSNSYTDTNILENSVYYYKISSVDKSGNESSYIYGSVTTPISNVLPFSPKNFSVYASDENASLVWDHPDTNTDEINSYLITYKLLKSDNSILSQDQIFISKQTLSKKISSLQNGKKYEFTIQTVDNKGRISNGISVIAIPNNDLAPPDPDNITVSESGQESGPNSVMLDINWLPGGDEYEVSTGVNYRVYFSIDGVQNTNESLYIETSIDQLNLKTSIAPFSGINVPIPENTLITLRITSISLSGYESKGTYYRFKTNIYTKTQTLRNVESFYDIRTIKVTWNNNPDTYKIKILVERKPIDDEYVELQFVSEEITDRIWVYFISEPSLGFTYYVSLTPINQDGIYGETSTISQNTLTDSELAYPQIPYELDFSFSFNSAELKWKIPDDNLLIKNYNIYRAQKHFSVNYSDYELIDTLPYSATNFTDYGLIEEEYYSYYITSIDIFNRESKHLKNDYSNIGLVSFKIPIYSGTFSSVLNPEIILDGFSSVLTWEIIHGEPFDAFQILKSVDSLHDFTPITTVDYSTTQTEYSYRDENAITESNIPYYYIIRKISNDTIFLAQTSSIYPENSIYLGYAILSDSSFIEFNMDGRRNISLLHDTLSEYTDSLLYYHLHRGIGTFETKSIKNTNYIFPKTDASEIDLNPSLVVTEWSTTDGSEFYTNEDISGGSIYSVKVNGFFPKPLYTIDENNGKIFFAEPLLIYNKETNSLEGTANIELTVFGIEETDGTLQDFRIGDLNAQKIGFSKLVNSQIPSLNHEGRINERLIPANTKLQRYDNNTFISDQSNKSTLFGECITFFSVTDKASELFMIQNFENLTPGDISTFQAPDYSDDTKDNITDSYAGASIEESFSGSSSYKITFKYKDDDPGRWVRLTTYNFNPIIDLRKKISIRIMVQNGSFYLGAGIRKSYTNSTTIGSDGGTIFSDGQEATIEFVGVEELIDSSPDHPDVVTPKGKYLVVAQPGVWQTFEFEPLKENIIAYTGNGTLSTSNGYATLEHLNFTINPDNTEEVILYIDELVQINDTLAAGTSQGIQKSSDYGSSWNLVRYTETPVFKFFKSNNNPYIWGISSKNVFLSTSVDQWYEVSGISTVQTIRDICEDSYGNIYVSSDKGVFVLKINDFASFSEFLQTQITNAFSTETYAIWHDNNFIYVSTEIGIYSTDDFGETWAEEPLLTSPVPLYEIIETSYGLFSFSKHSIFRKINGDPYFVEICNLNTDIDEVEEIWKIEIFNSLIYVSTNNGIYMNTQSDIYNVSALTFDKVFSSMDILNYYRVGYSLDVIGSELFIGSENILYSSNILNELSVKREYLNRDKPTININGIPQKTGFIYNSFNGVVSFRESLTMDETVYLDNLPRKVFNTEYAGWAQANIESPIVINKNGEPIWVDFKLNGTSVLDFVTAAKAAIQSSVSLLNYKNSNISDDLINRTIASADTILSGDVTYDSSGNISSTSPIIDKKTVGEFLKNYSFYVFSIDHTKVTTVFPSPTFIINGQNIENRDYTDIYTYEKIGIDDLGYNVTLSGVINYTDFKNAFYSGYLQSELLGRAKEKNLSYTSVEWQAIQSVLNILDSGKTTTSINIPGQIEEDMGFTAQDASGIIIDPYSGKINFSSVGTSLEERNKFSFNKEDYLTANLIGAQIGDIGSVTHNKIENSLELVNSGMPYDLSANVHGNIIKTGIFFERQYPGIFRSMDVSNIKSKYNTAYTRDWYDILNSTIDYNVIDESENTPVCSVPYCMAWFGNEDPYFNNKLWIGTDVTIFEYTVDFNGVTTFERTISPPGIDSEIRAIILNNTSIYVIANNKIYLSENYGITWSLFSTENLPEYLYSLGICINNMIVGTNDGVWWNTDNYSEFSRSNIFYSSLLSSNEKIEAEKSFVSSVFNIEIDNYVFLESRKNFFISQSGAEFIAIGPINLNSVSIVNKIYSYKNLLWVATDKGLYCDAGTAFSEKIAFSLQLIKPTGYESIIAVNDITSSIKEINTEHEALYVGGDDGSVYRYKAGIWKEYQTSLLSVHKMILIEDFEENYIVAVGYNNIVIFPDSIFDPITDSGHISVIEPCKD
jgi:fibronectin type 3 domain-containing protein